MSRFYTQVGRETPDAGKRASIYIPSERVWMLEALDEQVFNLERDTGVPYSRSKFLLDMIELGLQTFAETDKRSMR